MTLINTHLCPVIVSCFSQTFIFHGGSSLKCQNVKTITSIALIEAKLRYGQFLQNVSHLLQKECKLCFTHHNEDRTPQPVVLFRHLHDFFPFLLALYISSAMWGWTNSPPVKWYKSTLFGGLQLQPSDN